MYGPYIFPPQQPRIPGFPIPQRPRTIIDSGTALKNRTGPLNIRFNRNFPRPPVVVVTPFWRGQNTQVGFVETITSVSRNGFTVVSNNAADNYYVNWIAVLQEE